MKSIRHFTLTAPTTGESFAGELHEIAMLGDGDEATFGHFHHDDLGGPVAMVVYETTGLVFTTTDWQGVQPDTVEEIPDWQWMGADGRRALMLDGLPVDGSDVINFLAMSGVKLPGMEDDRRG